MLEVAMSYIRLLEENGAKQQCADPNLRFDIRSDRTALLNHTYWQLRMVCYLIHRIGGESSAIRLFGAAQGLLIATGLITVGESWNDNKKWLDRASLLAFDSAQEELAALSGGSDSGQR